MNTVDLRRLRRFGVKSAAVAAIAVLYTQPASAEVAHPNLIPVDSAYIMSVPDAPGFWKAWESNGLYDAFKKIMAMKDVEEKMADFQKELGIIEGSLGFKIDGATLSQVFASADVYVRQGDQESLDSIAVFSVTDNDKLTKLIDLAEKAAQQASASDDESTETKTSDSKSTSVITETEHNGVVVKIFKSKEDSKASFVYARPEGKLILGMSEKDVQQTIDRLKATEPGADTMAASEDYKKIESALTAEKGEFYIYGNQDEAMKMQSNDKDMPAGITSALKSLVDKFTPITYYGASVKFAPKEIATYSYGIIKEGTSDSLLLRNPGDQPLKFATYIPEGNILAGGTSLFDADTLYDLGKTIADSVANEASQSDGADQDDDDKSTDSKKSTESVEDQVKKAETVLGFSIKEDLVPALGNEMGIAINEVQFGALIPTVDANIMIGVRDADKMKKVVQSLEKLALQAAASKDIKEFTTVEAGGQTVKYLDIPGLFGFAPGYVLTDEFLIVGSTKSALVNAAEAKSSSKNLATGDALKSLGHHISANANMLQFANLGKIIDIAVKVTKQLPAAQEVSKYLEAFQILDASGSINRVENGAAVSRGVLKLK